MPFDAYDCSLSLIRSLVPLLERVSSRDAKHDDQMRRAAQSVALNVAEANQRRGRDRSNRFRIALGSAAEVASGLDIAVAFSYLGEHDASEAYALVDRVRAMTYRLANR